MVQVKYYLPLGTPFLDMYKSSPLRAQREVAKGVEENDRLVQYVNGLPSIQLENEMVGEGNKENFIGRESCKYDKSTV